MIIFLAVFIAVSGSFGQYKPLIDLNFKRYIPNEYSGDLEYDHLRWIANRHRETGYEDYYRTAIFFEKKTKEYGLEDGKIVRRKIVSSFPVGRNG